MQLRTLGVVQQAVLAAVAVVAVTVWWCAHLDVVPGLLLLLLSVVLFWLLGTARVGAAVGLPLVTLIVALLVAATGGDESVYVDLFLVVIIAAALVAERLRGLLGAVAVAGLGAATPALYGDVARVFVVDTVADLLVWIAVGLVTWRVARTSAEHERARTALLERYTTVAEDERDRLADDLHDEAIQLLAAAQLRLGADTAERSAETTAAHGLLADGLQSLRRLMLELKCPDVANGSLEAMVGDYAERLLGPSDVAVRVDVTLPPDLDRDVATGAYRIIVQALSNVVRHADATTVEVVAQVEDGQLVVRVRDDGRGLPAEVVQRPGHIGLRSMRDRAEVLGGHAEVRRLPASEGGGTQVSFALPLRLHAATIRRTASVSPPSRSRGSRPRP